jgi:hypothetical protein
MMPGDRKRSSTPLPPWVEHPSLTSTMVPVPFDDDLYDAALYDAPYVCGGASNRSSYR